MRGILGEFLGPWQIKNGQTRHNSSFELGQRQIQTPFYRGILWNPVTFQGDHLAGANRGIPLTSKMNQNQRPGLNWVLWCDSAGSRHIFEEKITINHICMINPQSHSWFKPTIHGKSSRDSAESRRIFDLDFNVWVWLVFQKSWGHWTRILLAWWKLHSRLNGRESRSYWRFGENHRKPNAGPSWIFLIAIILPTKKSFQPSFIEFIALTNSKRSWQCHHIYHIWFAFCPHDIPFAELNHPPCRCVARQLMISSARHRIAHETRIPRALLLLGMCGRNFSKVTRWPSRVKKFRHLFCKDKVQSLKTIHLADIQVEHWNKQL